MTTKTLKSLVLDPRTVNGPLPTFNGTPGAVAQALIEAAKKS